MNKTTTLRSLIFFVLALLALTATQTVYAQGELPTDDKQSGLTEDELGSELLQEFNKDFDIVFKAVKDALEKEEFLVSYASKRRKLVETDFKVLASDDDFAEVMNLYGEVPYIRSPGWTVGRTKVEVRFEELDNGKIAVKVVATMSGFESRFTNRWHYWKSNGRLEEGVMDAIVAEVEATS